MKTIARITTQKRNKERYNIFISEGDKEQYAFSVDEAILVRYTLKKGMELTEILIENILRQDTLYEAYTRAIQFLSYRMRTKKEIHTYLRTKEIDTDLIEEVITRLEREKLVDDGAFAQMFVRTRIRTSDKGPGYVRRELKEKGVLEKEAEQALQLYTFDIQVEKARAFAEKKQRQKAKESAKQQKQRIQASLMQKGFTQDVIAAALATLTWQQEDTEQTALHHQGEKLLRKHSRTYNGYELKQKIKEGLYRKGFQLDAIEAFLQEVLE